MSKNFFKIVILTIIFFNTSCASLFHSTKGTFEKGKKEHPYDVIVVPGYPYDGNSWNTVIKMRVVWAKYLYDRGYTKNVIFSGAAVHSPYIESIIMREFAIAKGIPEERIFTEEKAEHTVENIYYSYRIAKENGFKKIALATDPFQTNNSRHFIKKYELNINLLPVVIDTLISLDKTEPEINDSLARVNNFIPLKERENFFQRTSGTFGKHIEWKAEDLKKKRFQKKLRK